MNKHIIAFTYDIAKTASIKYVIFKVLPAPGVDLANVYATYYMSPKELSNLEFDMTTYIPHQMKLRLLCNVDDRCSTCNKLTYQKEKVCLNRACTNFKQYDFYSAVCFGKEILKYEDLNYKDDDIPCKQCTACKVCKKLKNVRKCTRHVICRHKKSKTQYHILNKLVTGNKNFI